MSASNSLPNEKIIFKCDRHAAIISEKLLSFYEDNEFFDTVLIAGSDSVVIQAHRIVLSALSEYFLQIFRGSQMASKDHIVELKEIDAPTLKLIIDFMYSGWIELSLEKVDSLLRIAAFLKMKTLVDGCSDFIKTHIITPSNCLEWFRLATELNLSGLKEGALNCAYTHFEEVSKEKELMLLKEEELKDLLFNDNPHGDFEEHVFLAMVAWIKYDKVNRKDLTFQLLSMVRYQCLTPKFIVENRKSVCKTVESYELICSWLQWHLSPETRSVDKQIGDLRPRKGKLTAISYSNIDKLSLQTYNPKVDTWSIEKEIPFCNKRQHWSMIVIDEKLIVVGGFINNVVTLNSVECLDLRTFKWTDLPPMENERYDCQLANLNGNLCVYGGYDNGNVLLNILEIYNFITRKWNSVKPLSKLSDHGQIVVNNRILHIVDFYNGCMQSYDASSNQWVSKELVKKELKFFGLAAVDRYLYVIGGYSEYGRVNIVSRYDLSNDTWRKLTPLSQARSDMNSLVVGNKIFICGGNSDNNKNILEEYNPETDTWKTLNSEIKFESYNGVLCTLPIKL